MIQLWYIPLRPFIKCVTYGVSCLLCSSWPCSDGYLTSEKVCVPQRDWLPKSSVMHRDIKAQSGVIHVVQSFTYKHHCIVINCTSWDEGVFNVWSGCLHWAHQQPDPCTQWITEIKTCVYNQIKQLMQQNSKLSICNNKQCLSNTLFFSNILTWTWWMATDAQAKFAVAT